MIKFFASASDNSTGTVQSRTVVANSLGFRGPEVQERSHRVVCMGDSITFGWHASGNEGTYPHFLQQELEDLDVDVVNAGMPRCNAMDMLDLYITRVQPLKPDVVVLVVGWNDISYQLTHPVESTAPRPIPADAFGLVQLLRTALFKIEQQDTDKIIKDRETAPDKIRWQFVPTYRRIVENFITTARAQGTTPVIVSLAHFFKDDLSHEEKERMLPHLISWPGMSYDGWWSMVKRINKEIRSIAEDNNVDLVECETAIPSEHFTDICHLDDDGNQLFAKRIAVKVRELLAK